MHRTPVVRYEAESGFAFDQRPHDSESFLLVEGSHLMLPHATEPPVLLCIVCEDGERAARRTFRRVLNLTHY